MRGEFQLIEWIKKAVMRREQGELGIGDDAAVLGGARGRKWVIATDAIVEGVDFLRRKASGRRVGYKALAINLSDLAAMGARPLAFVVTLGIPKNLPGRWIHDFYRGMLRLARRFHTHCVGGDLTASRDFFASLTILGDARAGEILTRDGARVGDRLVVTGRLGSSLLRRHLDFEPRVREGRFLAKGLWATAMIDLSDGLWQDLGHLLKASGVGVTVDLDRIPISRDARTVARLHPSRALEHALTDGEDFELLFTVPRRKWARLVREWKKHFPRVLLTCIGEILPPPVRIQWRWGGKKVPAPRVRRKGFSHF